MATISPAHVILGAGLVVLVFVLPYGPILGNYWIATGVVGNIPLLYGTRDPVIGAVAWAVSQQLALLAAILLAALAFRWGHGNLAGVRTLRAAGERPVGSPGARGSAAALPGRLRRGAGAVRAGGLRSTTGISTRWSRWLRSCSCEGRPRPLRVSRSLVFACGATAWLAVSAFLIAANSFAYDAARWRAGEAAVAIGYNPVTVDAGLGMGAGDHSAGFQEPGSTTE